MIYVLPYKHQQSENFISKLDNNALFLYLVEEPCKIYKKNITLDYSLLDTDERVIIIGAEVLKHLFRTSGITKYAGTIQSFYSKELDKEISVGLIPDLKTLEIYPYKESEFIEYFHNIFNYKKGTFKVNFHYPGYNYKNLIEVTELLKDVDTVVIDLECSSLFPHKGKILGIVIAPNTQNSYYIEWKDVDPKLLYNFLKDKKIIGHNIKFDIKWLKHNGVDLTGPFIKLEDTMFLSYLSNENTSNKLKDLAIKYTPFGAYDKQLEIEKTKLCKVLKIKKGEFTYDLFPPEIIGPYACYDGVATFYIYNHYKDRVTADSMIYYLLLDASKEFALLELNGCYIDKKQLQQLVKNQIKEIDLCKDKMLTEIASVLNIHKEDVEINFNSPKQLSNLLFNIFGYSSVKETDGGQNSTDAEVLNILMKEQSHISEFAGYLLKYRKLTKYLSTYLTSILNNLDEDGYIRSSFNLIGTVSGRLSSGKDSEVVYKSSRDGTINFQNIPSRDKMIKKLFIAEYEDWEILNLDLKNAELWVVGVIANERKILDAFARGEDIHSSTAKLIFPELKNVDVNIIKSDYNEYRQKAKTVNFAILYLAGPGKIAQELNITKTEARKLIDGWFKAYPAVHKWLQQVKLEAETYGTVTTYFGRERFAQEVFSSNQYLAQHYVKSLVNSLIQSVASDINLAGYCNGMREIRKQKLRYKPFGLVHDSIVGAVHKADKIKVIKILVNTIQSVIDITPKIGVDAESGRSWGELSEVVYD